MAPKRFAVVGADDESSSSGDMMDALVQMKHGEPNEEGVVGVMPFAKPPHPGKYSDHLLIQVWDCCPSALFSCCCLDQGIFATAR